MSSSPEIQKLHDEIKEIKRRKYQRKLEQKKKELLDEENGTKDDDSATFDEREAEKKEIYKYMLGAILSYTLLMLFMLSTFFIIHKLRQYGCNLVEDGFMKMKKVLETSGGDSIGMVGYDDNMTDAEKTEFINTQLENQINLCQHYLTQSFNKNSAIVTLHNLTFGLVSAVVVSQIGSHQQQQQGQQKTRAMNKLTNQLLHATKATPGSHIVSRLIYNFITWTPRLYVLTWIFTGCSCLVCSSMWSSEYSGPLYVTGLAWLGMAITTVYLFFGLQEKETGKENNDSKKQEDVVNGHNNDSNGGDDDGIDAVADGNKHNDKMEKCERDLIIGIASEENNAVTSSVLLQTAAFPSRFVVEEAGNDEEEGTLYLTGTSIN